MSPLVTQLPWTHNLLILSRSKRAEEREFYLRLALRERLSRRELERQLNGALFERVVLSPAKVSSAVTQLHPDAISVFKDAYLVDFLDLTAAHSEADLQRVLLANLRQFLLELGGDFTFVGERYRLQVGARDFFLDLLFYHRGLTCLVAFELKVEQFEPADLGQLQFYLEALDRDVKKPHERPSIGVLLCATKDSEVVEYALSRTVSPTLVAEYQTSLPDKRLLQAKLHEFYELATEQAALPAIERANRRSRERSARNNLTRSPVADRSRLSAKRSAAQAERPQLEAKFNVGRKSLSRSTLAQRGSTPRRRPRWRRETMSIRVPDAGCRDRRLPPRLAWHPQPSDAARQPFPRGRTQAVRIHHRFLPGRPSNSIHR